MVMKKSNQLKKKILAIFLTVLMIATTIPLNVFAASNMNLGEKDNNSTIDVEKETHYGHELHYTPVGGTNYPLFCIECGKTSPSKSTLGSTGKPSDGKVLEAAKWIFAGYYMEHGNSINWLDMAYCQKKVWSVMGSNTSWTFSDTGYNNWIKQAEQNMKNIEKYPSFNGDTNETIKAGDSKTYTDTNGVFKDYPAFTKNDNGIKIVHTENSNDITITISKTCTKSTFRINSGEYHKQLTGNENDCLLYNPKEGGTQKLLYSAYYDPISFTITGKIQPIGNLQLKKTSEDGKVSGINFSVTGPNGFNRTIATDGNGEWKIEGINPGTYTVTEESISKYVPQNSQTVTVEGGNKTATVTFSNVLKKFRVSVNKQDIEKTHPQGDAKLGGAIYGLYHGDTLVAQYTTQNDGTFTTDYFVCDTNWTLKEIQPSEGYLLDKTVYPVGADPQLYTVEYNWTSNTVKEQVKKGKVSIIKHTDDGSTKIETPEKGAEFQLYLKSSGSFVNADPDERDTIICDVDGFASSKLLPYGVYTVHQTKGWDGREKIKDFDVFIDTDMKEYKFLINNSNFESYLKVVKLDAETGKQIAYEGAGFEIYDSDGQRVNMQFTYPEITSIHTFYTNSEGYLITPEKLPYGDYTLKEVQAPYGYVLDSTPIPFTITQENSSTDTGVTVVKVKARDMAQKGVIEITKTGKIFKSVIESEGIYTPVYEIGNLANAVFEIYAAEDITTLDGTVRYQQGEKVDEITTDKNGIAKSKQLYLGKYTVIEKTAPDTFVNANEQYDVELTYAGQNVSATSTALSVFNDRQKVSVSLLKELSKDERFKLGMNDEILSVQFGIYANEDITAADGTVIPKDALITYGNCDENGKLTFNCDLPIGYKFYAKEMETDNHYILSDTKYEFNTEYQGQDVETINIDLNNGEPIVNDLIYGTIKGLKIDRETEKAIKGALFGLFKSDTTEYTETNAILTAESDENGIFVFDNIPFGDYVIKELKPAENYLPSDDIHHITVTDNEQIIEITAVNDRIPELKTTATINGEKEVTAKGEITIDDVVEYKHLVPGKEYKIVGTLMDKSTGKPFEIDGKPVTSEVTFTPEKPNGKVTVSFTFDASAIKETTELVVFETLYRDNVEIAVHADIDDEGQTVKINVPVPDKPSTPKTGDDRNYGFWIGLGFIAIGGVISAVILKIKIKKDEDED